MGLEAINYLFRSENKLDDKILQFSGISRTGNGEFLFQKTGEYWIDLELISPNELSIRVTLCNPTDPVLSALGGLLNYLLNTVKGKLLDTHSKEVHKIFDLTEAQKIKDSFLGKKKVFTEMYGDFIAAIGSDEFYSKMDDNGNLRK